MFWCCSVCFCTGCFVMVPLNMTDPHCVQHIRPCQIGMLLNVNLSLTNLGTYSQKHTNQKRKHNFLRQKQCILYTCIYL